MKGKLILCVGLLGLGFVVTVVISVWSAIADGSVGKTVADEVSKAVTYRQPNPVPLEKIVTGKERPANQVNSLGSDIELLVLDTKMIIPEGATRLEFLRLPKWLQDNEADFGLRIVGPGYKFFRHFKKTPWDEIRISLQEADVDILSRALVSAGVPKGKALGIVCDRQGRLLSLNSLDLLKRALETTRNDLVSERNPAKAAELGLLLLSRGSALCPTGVARYFVCNGGGEVVYLIQSIQGDPSEDNFAVYAFNKEGNLAWTGAWSVSKPSHLRESGLQILLRILIGVVVVPTENSIQGEK